MADFIAARKKELELCDKLLLVRAAIKGLKGEDFIAKQELVVSVEIAIRECEQLLNEMTANKNVETNRERFKEKAKTLIGLMGNLMKETNFYGGDTIYKDVLKDLCRATIKFKKNAE